jgi:hypothetical protein
MNLCYYSSENLNRGQWTGRKICICEKNYMRWWVCVITVPKVWTMDKQLAVISVFVETYYARKEYVLWQLGISNSGWVTCS